MKGSNTWPRMISDKYLPIPPFTGWSSAPSLRHLLKMGDLELRPFQCLKHGKMMKANWWFQPYPPEKYEFVRLDHHPNYWGKSKPCSKPPNSISHCRILGQILRPCPVATPPSPDRTCCEGIGWPLAHLGVEGHGIRLEQWFALHLFSNKFTRVWSCFLFLLVSYCCYLCG